MTLVSSLALTLRSPLLVVVMLALGPTYAVVCSSSTLTAAEPATPAVPPTAIPAVIDTMSSLACAVTETVPAAVTCALAPM